MGWNVGKAISSVGGGGAPGVDLSQLQKGNAYEQILGNSNNWGSNTRGLEGGALANDVGKLNPLNVGKTNASVAAPNNPTIGGPGMPAGHAPTIAHTQITQTPGAIAAANQFNTSKAYDNGANRSQTALMTQLAAQANGTGPSLASQQLQQGEQANIAGTMAQLASQRGAANPLMQRTALEANQNSQAATNQQAANARIQEQYNAQNALAGVSNNVANQGLAQRGQDIGVDAQNANLAQGANLATYGGNLQTNLNQGHINAGQATGNANLQAGYNSLGAQYAGLGVQAQGINAQIAQSNAANSQKTVGGLLGAGGAVLGGMAAGGTGLFGAGAAASPTAMGAGGLTGAEVASFGGIGGASSGVVGAGGLTADEVGSFGAEAAPVAEGGAEALSHGGYVTGSPTVSGDSLKNDKVHVMLSPGEVVLPRTVVNAKDPVAAFKAFMSTVNKKPVANSTNNTAIASIAKAQSRVKGK